MIPAHYLFELLRTRPTTWGALAITPLAWWAGYGWVAVFYWVWRWLIVILESFKAKRERDRKELLDTIRSVGSGGKKQ